MWRVSDGTIPACKLGNNRIGALAFEELKPRAAADESGRVAARADKRGDEFSLWAGYSQDRARLSRWPGAGTGVVDDDTSRLRSGATPAERVRSHEPRAADVPFDVVTAGERILLADANTENDIDNVVRFVDVRTQQDVGEFMIDTASCCYPSYLRFHPDRHRLLTGWNDRGIFRLRLWRVLPTIEEMRDFARATVPECLSPERRKELGLEPDSPHWCIEAAKLPYDTAAWKQWLAEKIAGKNPSIPR
jgi:hypothetical protein